MGRRSIGGFVVVVGLAMAVGLAANAQEPAAQAKVLVPRVSGEWWPVAGNPDLGPLTGDRQQPVDFAVWRAADGTWQLWSCIRKTKCGGKTRLFFGWEGQELTDRDWTPRGIVMEADPNVGETAGGLQAPHVIKRDGQFLLFYGDWQHIALATGPDGKSFKRRMNQHSGTSGLFGEHPGSNTRDAMVLESAGRLYCYYTAYPDDQGAVYCRVSAGDPAKWGPSKVVAFGGAAGSGPFSAECPHVVEREEMYYLFRTQRYGQEARTTVYRSADPLDFGVNDDRFRVGELPIAAPEIVRHDGQDYIFALNPGLDGIRAVRLEWVIESE